jgi:hypothetical protein
MSYLDIRTQIRVDEFMDDLSTREIESIVEWIKDNQPQMFVGNASAQELLFHQQVDHIKENYSRLTIEQEEQVKQIYESL